MQDLRGASVPVYNLRAGAALALQGSSAEGETRTTAAWQIEHGYDNLLGKARALNADINYLDQRSNTVMRAWGFWNARRTQSATERSKGVQTSLLGRGDFFRPYQYFVSCALNIYASGI